MSTSQETKHMDTLRAIDQARSGPTGNLRQFVSFRVASEDYAVDILSVREIKGWTRTTYLPSQPEYVRGVLNLRGAIVPVFDLNCRFGASLTEATSKHVVIIVSVKNRLVGLLVDMVSDILSVAESAIGPVPETETTENIAFLEGILSINDSMVVILNLDALFENITRADEANDGLTVA